MPFTGNLTANDRVVITVVFLVLRVHVQWFPFGREGDKKRGKMPTLTRNQRRQIAQEKQDMPFVDVHEVSGEPQEAKAEDEPPLPASVPNHKDEEGTRRRRGHKHSSTTSKRNRVASESLEESTEDSDTATSDDQGTGNHRRRKHNPNQNGSHSLMKTTPGTQNRTNEMTTTTGDASKDVSMDE